MKSSSADWPEQGSLAGCLHAAKRSCPPVYDRPAQCRQRKKSQFRPGFVLKYKQRTKWKSLHCTKQCILQELSAGASQVCGGEQLSAEFIRQLECITRKTQKYYCEIVIKYSYCTLILNSITLIPASWQSCLLVLGLASPILIKKKKKTQAKILVCPTVPIRVQAAICSFLNNNHSAGLSESMNTDTNYPASLRVHQTNI